MDPMPPIISMCKSFVFFGNLKKSAIEKADHDFKLYHIVRYYSIYYYRLFVFYPIADYYSAFIFYNGF